MSSYLSYAARCLQTARSEATAEEMLRVLLETELPAEPILRGLGDYPVLGNTAELRGLHALLDGRCETVPTVRHREEDEILTYPRKDGQRYQHRFD